MGIKTADRTLDLLELFARERNPLSLTEMVELMGIPLSSAHGLVKTLQSRGYLFEISRKQGYFPTRKLSTLAESITGFIPLLGTCEPHLIRLQEQTGETVVLGKRQGDAVIYLDVFECSKSVRFSPAIGEIKPLHSTASGKAVLGSLRGAEFDAVLKRIPFVRHNPNTIADAEKLRQEIDKARKRGWYHIVGEHIPDLMSIAAPVQFGDESYVVVVGGPIQRFKPLLNDHAKKLLKVCGELEKQVV